MWKALQKGSLIDVIAPASRCPLDELQAGLKLIESWGLRVRVPKDLFGQHWAHSHSDEKRFQQLNSALMAPDSQALWIVRGGYGSIKLLPYLQKISRPKINKVFLGLSDVTSLHLFMNQKWKWSTLHAPIISRLGQGNLPSKSINELRQILFGRKDQQIFKIKPLNTLAKNFKGEAQLVGGNMVTFQTCIGTPFQWKPKNTFLFLEDVGERAYRLDRIWEHFLQTGLLQQCRGVILGDFTGGQEPDGRQLIPTFIKDRAKTCPVPLFSGLPVGHGDIQRTLPLGTRALIRDNQLFVESGYLQ